MARRMPSFKALLALAAIVGWQNRDKLAGVLKDPNAPGGALDQAKKQAGIEDGGVSIKKGLEELVKKFDQAGEGDKARSWVGTGDNKPVDEPTIERASGPDLIGDLAKQLNISREELLKRLTQALPDTVNTVTPAGRIPT